jgi:hypothetical protein
MRYRRADVAGGTDFFTVNLAERKRTSLVEHVDVLRAVNQKVNTMHPLHIERSHSSGRSTCRKKQSGEVGFPRRFRAGVAGSFSSAPAKALRRQ